MVGGGKEDREPFPTQPPLRALGDGFMTPWGVI